MNYTSKSISLLRPASNHDLSLPPRPRYPRQPCKAAYFKSIPRNWRPAKKGCERTQRNLTSRQKDRRNLKPASVSKEAEYPFLGDRGVAPPGTERWAGKYKVEDRVVWRYEARELVGGSLRR